MEVVCCWQFSNFTGKRTENKVKGGTKGPFQKSPKDGSGSKATLLLIGMPMI